MSYARCITLTNKSTLNPIPTRNEVYLIDGSSGPTGATGTVLTLPQITSDGMSFFLRRIDVSEKIVQVNTTGYNPIGPLNSINGTSFINIPSLSDTQIHSWNFNWYTVQGINPQFRGLPLNLRFTQPNGNGFENSANTWTVAGFFNYRGLGIDTSISSALVIGYTSNVNTYHRFRLYDRTNNIELAITTQANTGTVSIPIKIDYGPVTNLPVTNAIIEMQMLATDATGNTGITGRQAIGIHTVQIYG